MHHDNNLSSLVTSDLVSAFARQLKASPFSSGWPEADIQAGALSLARQHVLGQEAALRGVPVPSVDEEDEDDGEDEVKSKSRIAKAVRRLTGRG